MWGAAVRKATMWEATVGQQPISDLEIQVLASSYNVEATARKVTVWEAWELGYKPGSMSSSPRAGYSAQQPSSGLEGRMLAEVHDRSTRSGPRRATMSSGPGGATAPSNRFRVWGSEY